MAGDHNVLPEHVRFENALAIWIRDMREDQLELVKRGGRLSVAALAYEEVIKLRGIIDRIMLDRKRKIQRRWSRRKARREASGKCLSCRGSFCTAGRECVTLSNPPPESSREPCGPGHWGHGVGPGWRCPCFPEPESWKRPEIGARCWCGELDCKIVAHGNYPE